MGLITVQRYCAACDYHLFPKIVNTSLSEVIYRLYQSIYDI